MWFLIANVCVISATTPSTLTPTYETSSPQVSRKNSLISGCSRSVISALQEEGQQRETVIRFQLENEVTHPAELIKSDLVASASANQHVPGEIDLTKMECGGGSNKMGQLYFKVRYYYSMPRVIIYYVGGRCRRLNGVNRFSQKRPAHPPVLSLHT